MASLPVILGLTPPNIVVSQTLSIYNVELPVNQGEFTFGYVRQVNYQTLSFYAGQRILYPQPPNTPSILINSEPYFIIDENKIFLTEPTDITPP